VLAQLKVDFPADLRIVYRHYPLVTIHDKAAMAAQAAEAAGAQGKFWQMHDLLYLRQNEWAGLPADQFPAWVTARAKELRLAEGAFASDFTGLELNHLVMQAWESGQEIGIPGTPFLLINGEIYTGPTDYTNLSLIVRLYSLQIRQFSSCPPMIVDSNREYTAVIESVRGNIVIELFADLAPLAVNNFVFLAQNGWYNGVTFHRVIPGRLAQAGDPSGTGFGGPGYAFVNEYSDLTFDQPGMLAMANAGSDTNGSQFFITFGPEPGYNGEYTIFGRVIDGLLVAQLLTPRNPDQGGLNLPPGDKIITIRIEVR